VAVALGSTATFKALLQDSAGQTIRDVTQEVQWSSSDPTVLSIERGLALTSGHAFVQVRLGEQRNALGVGVQAPDIASLAIERLSVNVFGPNSNGNFLYEPRFLLTETSGNSGATIVEDGDPGKVEAVVNAVK
jgi:hypothetical protein